MAEPAAKKKRQRKVPNAATVTISITKTEMVVKARRQWLLGGDSPEKYGHVDDVWPQAEKTSLLEQTLPAEKFDLSKVLKAINGL